MSNPVNRKSSKYNKVLRQIAKDGGFALDGKNYGVLCYPDVPEGHEMSISGEINITPSANLKENEND